MSLGLRIKQARLRRGLSLRDLAEKADVSHTAISKYEKERILPGSDVLIRLSKALDIGLDFFLRPQKVGEIRPAYRKKASLKKKDEKKLIEEIRDWLERYLEAEQLSPAAGEEEPHFKCPDGFPRETCTFDEVEQAAIDLRRAWDIGLDPMEDLTGHLEDKGIKVGVIEAPDRFDACTFEAEINGGVPVIVTRKGLPGDRQRFNLAHELGHLMLRVCPNPTEERFDEERACHRFAAAFIAPRPTILEDFGLHRQTLGLHELHVLKLKYGLSMQALIYRAQDLSVITPASAQRLFQYFRTMGWHVNEPGTPIAAETPTRFRLLVHQALAEDIISHKRAAELYKEPLETPEEREAFGLEVAP